MFLKSITINGFKSFANHTELQFVNGITAVVGPNGSGKSNISDGIRWVLGEQSAKSLRGGKMEDVIFAGSDTRKKVNFAEVSLTLDNTDRALSLDFDEVTVTRRVHRSGDSEYLINKQNCRLKDITELFLDTGIGKEAYSIIGQGRIEEILSSKSEDRRVIFEEAAGISKYKQRKREAEKKLDDTEANLLRIYDLIAELEGQVEPLRDQSEKATAFKALREKLKQHELSLYVYQIQETHKTWQSSESLKKVLEQRQLELSTVVNQHDATLEKQRLDLRRLEEQLELLQQQFMEVSENAEKTEGALHVLHERRSHAEQHLSHASLVRTQLKERIEHKQLEISNEQAKADQVLRVLQEVQRKLREEEQQLTGVSDLVLHFSDDQLKSELLETLNELARVRNEIRYAEQQRDAAHKQQLKMVEIERSLREQLQQYELALADWHRKQQQIDAQIAECEQTAVGAVRDRSSFQEQMQELQATLTRLKQEEAALRSRSETMGEMQNDYEGYSYGVKEVLKNKGKNSGLNGIHGAVAELVQVPKQYEVAVEVALGGALQHVVVTDERAARTAIQYLKQRQLGRATFLPMDVIRARHIAQDDLAKLQAMNGFIGVAADLLKADAQYMAIVRNLLGAVLIAEHLESANTLAAASGYRYRIVTLDGDVVNAGGSMTGGSLQKKTGNLLGRQRLLEELAEQIRVKHAEVVSCDDELLRLGQQIQDADSSIALKRVELEEKRLSRQAAHAQMEQTHVDIRDLQERLALLSDDLTEQVQSERLSEEQIALETERRDVLATKERNLQAAIEHADVSRKEQEGVKEQMQEQLVELKIKLAQLRQEHQSLNDLLQRMRSELSGLEFEWTQNEEASQDWQEQKTHNDTEIENKQTMLDRLKTQKQQLSETLAFARAEKAQGSSQLEADESLTREQRLELRQVDEQLHQADITLNRCEVELDYLLKKLSEDYELSFELAQKKYPIPEDVPVTQQHVRDLKRQISALGDVNLGAIEEFARVSERFAFLTSQRDDLDAAKQTLYEVIKEINGEMGKRFLTAFEQIRSRFSGVFTSLFGGGRADLILSEPERILTTGIEIVAQPPGKSLKNLQLLSGGERALTAIALLFSILHIKPVPFCVLDEVEAALDEANVSRFAGYLREFAQQTQFIVVTHRKGTMEEADVLYGVTMQDSGVSKLVSVKLEEERGVI